MAVSLEPQGPCEKCVIIERIKRKSIQDQVSSLSKLGLDVFDLLVADCLYRVSGGRFNRFKAYSHQCDHKGGYVGIHEY
jgi:hypothetical protein